MVMSKVSVTYVHGQFMTYMQGKAVQHQARGERAHQYVLGGIGLLIEVKA
jgi:hypothetical protein